MTRYANAMGAGMPAVHLDARSARLGEGVKEVQA